MHVEILRAVKEVLQALPELQGCTFAIRKRPAYLADHDSGRLVCLSPEAEEVRDLTFTNVAHIDWPVVVLYCDGDGDLANEDQALRLVASREAIRKALWRPELAGVEAVFGCEYDPDPPYDAAALDGVTDVSLQRFRFQTSGERAS
jgi:hypothetical protein